MSVFRIFFIVLSLSVFGGAWYVGGRGIGGESTDVPSPTDGSVRVGTSGGYYAGGSVK